jgi:hypothetical protein
MQEDTNGTVDNGPETLSEAERDNFGGQPEGETPSGYIANFEGDEIDGRRYKLGERIADTVDAGTIAYLVQNGRITPTTEGAAGSPSGSEGGTAPGGEPSSDTTGEGPTLTDEQQAEADKLVDGNTKDDLLALAEAEGVEGVTADNNKAEIAAKIVAARAE